MEKTSKQKKKPVKLIAIIVAIIVVIIAGVLIYRQFGENSWKKATKAEEIIIQEKDSKDVKKQKIQAKIELINKDIGKIDEELNIELEKMNKLYEEYINVMNEYQSGVTTKSK